jgi:hypothetical protein
MGSGRGVRLSPISTTSFPFCPLTASNETAARTAIPEVSLDVFGPVALVGLALIRLAIATGGALVSARRAAPARIAPVLQAE